MRPFHQYVKLKMVMLADYRHIHLIAIGGTGMAALAGMLKSAGYRVSGSDTHLYPPMSELLEQLGIPFAEGYRPGNLNRDIDLVIIGNAVPKSNPEVQAVLERSLPYMSFPQALHTFFLRDRFPIVVAGTHGKTTTAALTAWVLDRAGWEPGFLIGGWVKNFSGNGRMGKGNYFVVEGDEYDTAFFDKGPKFLHYHPQAAILTSIEFDHADIYSDLAPIKQAFTSFVRQIPPEGLLIAAYGDPSVREVTTHAGCHVETYALDPQAVWHAEALKPSGEGVTFRVFNNAQVLGEFFYPLAGRHNLLNVLSVIALTTRLGVPVETIRSALTTFVGVRRRQEAFETIKGVTVIDDFAHHPTAIRETLSALRLQYPRRRLWAVFEPRSATSRRTAFQREFSKVFCDADRVIIADLFAPEKIPVNQRLDPRRVIADLMASGVQAFFAPTVDEILKCLVTELHYGDVVCIMSSGDFGGLPSRLLEALKGHPIRSAEETIKGS